MDIRSSLRQMVKRGFIGTNIFIKEQKIPLIPYFNYKRNFCGNFTKLEQGLYQKGPHQYFATPIGLPTNERSAAFKILGKAESAGFRR